MRYHVLIVEDSEASRERLAVLVEGVAEGVAVIRASGGFEALKLLPRHRFDLIVTDLEMPDINGFELINFVKRSPHYGHTPLFIVTAVERASERDKGLRLGASEYLIKPLDEDAFVALVRRYLFPANPVQ